MPVFLLHVILVIAMPLAEVGGTQIFSKCRAMTEESPKLLSRLKLF